MYIKLNQIPDREERFKRKGFIDLNAFRRMKNSGIVFIDQEEFKKIRLCLLN